MSFMKKALLNIICGASLAWTVGMLGFVTYQAIEHEAKRNKVEYILDTNRDGNISSDEIKRFYNETETTPYIKQKLPDFKTEDLNKFLDKYEAK